MMMRGIMQAALHHRFSSLPFRRSFPMGAPHFYQCSPSKVWCSAAVPMLREFELALNSTFFQEYGPLVGSFVPVGVAMLGSKTFGFGAEKDFALAVSRCSVQLLVLAVALKFVFEGEKIIASILAVSFMVIVAGCTAGDRANKLPKSCFIATSSLACGTLGVLALMILLKATRRHHARTQKRPCAS